MKRGMLILFLLAFLLAGAVSAQEATPEATPLTPEELADPDGHFVDLDGISVYYREDGPADGQPVMLLHGFLGSSANWDDTLKILADAGYRAIAFDRPPFGLSDKRPDLDYSVEAQAALTAKLMDKLGIDSAVMVGHSAGGTVVSQFALAYPERVQKLVLVAGAVGINAGNDTGKDNAVAQTFNFLRQSNPNSPLARLALRAMFTGSFARNMLDQSTTHPDAITPEMIERNSRYLRLPGWEVGLLAYARDSRFDTPDLDSLKKVTVPVLLMWGEEDRVVPIEVGERLRDTFPNVTWKTYPNAGHLLMWDASEAFHKDLLAFLAS